MKRSYLITREQLDRVVVNYLNDKMKGGKITTDGPNNSVTVHDFITNKGSKLLSVYEYGPQHDMSGNVVEGPSATLAIYYKIISFFMSHLNIKEHKAIDLIADWFEDTYDFKYDKLSVFEKPYH